MLVTLQNNKPNHRIVTSIVIAGIIFISIGLLVVGKNLGYISSYFFNILISWQMILIILGLFAIYWKKYFGGIILISIGTFFIMPLIIEPCYSWIPVYWPVLLVLAGIFIFTYIIISNRKKIHISDCLIDIGYDANNEFVVSDNFLSSIRKIIINEKFSGANIKNTVGLTELDLVRAGHDPEDAIINIESFFGKVKIKIPYDWDVLIDIKSSLSNIYDKRKIDIKKCDSVKKLIINGKLKFSRLNIQNK
ncbi:MAG: cell wall-active antibiotics response protein [Bacteroidales bacterium]|jgi:predicted membrane protein|nr:cell wall-active antibiotics response protein [Bacteroidales bacterium]